jgi:hypothetical protein
MNIGTPFERRTERFVNKDKLKWEVFTNSLGPDARAYLRGQPAPEDGELNFEDWKATFSPDAQEALSRAADPPPISVAIDDADYQYCICVCRDGEFPILRRFSRVEQLADFVSQLRDQGVWVFAFHGLPVAMTAGPQRYLVLPDLRTAVTIPIAEHEPVSRVDLDRLDHVELQEDGYLGSIELMVPKTAST